MSFYGEPPVEVGWFTLPEWTEFMHYLYLPVRIPARDHDGDHRAATDVPARLGFLKPALRIIARDAFEVPDPYIYVTARRGFATPGNPLNRPGWHCDDFGGTDLNYIWSDSYPTMYLESDYPLEINPDDKQSMQDMERLAASASADKGYEVVQTQPYCLERLSPYVIHAAPEIPAPGGMRSFFKISVSTHRYDLVGNSHNHLIDYSWPMHDRQSLRNQPGAFQNKDYSGVGGRP